MEYLDPSGDEDINPNSVFEEFGNLVKISGLVTFTTNPDGSAYFCLFEDDTFGFTF